MEWIFVCVFCSASAVSVEEGVQYVEIEVRRSFGSQGEVSVAIATIEGTAMAPQGSDIFLLTTKGPRACNLMCCFYVTDLSGDVMALATIQLIETVSAERWYEFTRGSRSFLALASGSVGGSMLYVERRRLCSSPGEEFRLLLA